MKKLARRDRMKIYGDILLSIMAETKRGKIALTHIQQKSNVPFDRLKVYLSELMDLGLIQDESTLNLTEKGQQYVIEYEKVLDFMKRMGLSY
jgi:predicted transcriptional regulator